MKLKNKKLNININKVKVFLRSLLKKENPIKNYLLKLQDISKLKNILLKFYDDIRSNNIVVNT